MCRRLVPFFMVLLKPIKVLRLPVLGKESGLEVYSINLPELSQNILVKQKRISIICLARATDQKWILFFDEADALFGNRAGINE